MVKETKKDIKKSNKKSTAPKKETVKESNKKVVSKKKASSKKVEKKQKKIGLFKRIVNWFKSVGKEVSKVKWPSKKEMIKYSVATIVFVVFFALFFYVIELLMAFLKSLV